MRTLKNGYTYNHSKTLKITPELTAYSYDWYMLGKPLNEQVYIVNNYSYSNTTIKHMHKVLSYINQKGFSEIVYIQAPKGLTNKQAAIEYYEGLIEKKLAYIKKPRVQKQTKVKLNSEIDHHLVSIEQIVNYL